MKIQLKNIPQNKGYIKQIEDVICELAKRTFANELQRRDSYTVSNWMCAPISIYDPTNRMEINISRTTHRNKINAFVKKVKRMMVHCAYFDEYEYRVYVHVTRNFYQSHVVNN